MLMRLKSLVDDLGAPTAALYILHRLCVASRLPLSLYTYRLVAQPVAKTPQLPDARRAAFLCRRLKAGDPALSSMPFDSDVCARRFAQGALCYGLFRNDHICAWLWVVPDAYEEDEVRCRFVMAKNMVWDFDVTVIPQYRLGFAFAALWDCVNTDLNNQGVDWCISRISAFNLPSRRSHQRLGAVDKGWMIFFTVGPVQMMLQRGTPFFHLGLTRAARPTVRLKAPQE